MDEWNMTKMSAGEYTIHYDLCESTRLDTTKFKTEHPEMYASYSKNTVSTRFQVS
jgi:predicted phage-related endonuclease